MNSGVRALLPDWRVRTRPDQILVFVLRARPAARLVERNISERTLQSPDLRRHKAAVLLAPPLECLVGNAALQAVLVNTKPVIGLLQKRRYRLRGKSRSFHRSPLPCEGSLEKPRFERFSFRDEYQLDYSWERPNRSSQQSPEGSCGASLNQG